MGSIERGITTPESTALVSKHKPNLIERIGINAIGSYMEVLVAGKGAPRRHQSFKDFLLDPTTRIPNTSWQTLKALEDDGLAKGLREYGRVSEEAGLFTLRMLRKRLGDKVPFPTRLPRPVVLAIAFYGLIQTEQTLLRGVAADGNATAANIPSYYPGGWTIFWGTDIWPDDPKTT